MSEPTLQSKPPVIFLMGPTAAGKTACALELASKLPIDIVSVDSAMVYRGMDIGTAKPTPRLLHEFPHALIDIRDPTDNYSAANFREDALSAIKKSHASDRIPLLVGGTGLYFRVLEQGIDDLPKADAAIRDRLNKQYRAEGPEKMHAKLASIDPNSASRIHPNDPQRLLRALEIYELSGRAMSELFNESVSPLTDYRVAKHIVAPAERAELHQRIARRFHEMLQQGFINEVANLRRRDDLSLANSAMKSVGYRAIWQFLEGQMDYEEMESAGVAATRQLAKRQFTWFRSEANANWHDSSTKTVNKTVLEALKRDTLSD